jgi:hypothetical protein
VLGLKQLFFALPFLAAAFAAFNLNMKSHTCRAQQVEARLNLAQLLSAQRAYYERTGRYAGDSALLGWAPTDVRAYTYTLEAETGARFRATASGHLRSHGDRDRWTIDETGTLENVEDGCDWTLFHAFAPG